MKYPITPRVIKLAALGALSAIMVAGNVGCETDAWLHDPSVVGYWEHTPTKVPVLERISAIEGPEDQFVEIDDITPDDLMPVIEAYRATSGDFIDISIWDIPIVGEPGFFQPIVDSRGFIEVPDVGQIFVHGRTSDEIRDAIVEEARALVADPVVTVVISGRRDATYAIIGQVPGPGTYIVPEPDFRLLEALTTAGGIPESTPKVFIIRQVSLTDPVRSGEDAVQTQPPSNEQVPPASPEDLIDIIDELSNPDGGAPAVFANFETAPTFGTLQPVSDQPPIDLIDADDTPDEQGEIAPSEETGSWMFLNGRWVRVQPSGSGGGGAPAGDGFLGQTPETLVTQRVIGIPVKRLLSGDARYNPVVRPGDVIRVPAPEQGPVYIMGFVNRPGTYTLPAVGNLTLTQAVAAAGGLGGIAMPERVDLTRRVDETHMATIRLNLRAIFERTQPDIFLRSEDTINVGTNFWAFPWAVARNGFRVTYGFGFLLDRNFGNDVFGPPPVNLR